MSMPIFAQNHNAKERGKEGLFLLAFSDLGFLFLSDETDYLEILAWVSLEPKRAPARLGDLLDQRTPIMLMTDANMVYTLHSKRQQDAARIQNVADNNC